MDFRIVLAVVICVLLKPTIQIRDATFHKQLAKKDILQQLSQKENKNIAKNVIVFIGDGMGISTVTAARILKGQLAGQPGEETVLNFEKFPYTGLIKTYSEDKQVTDSAASATAIYTGVKTKSRMLRVDDSHKVGTCVKPSEGIPGIMQWTQEKGKSTGFVTTSRVTHATPAGLYAVTTNRDWESPRDAPTGCMDIATQLVRLNPDIKVIMGGGVSNFLKTGFIGASNASQTLIQAWEEDKINRSKSYGVAYDRAQLEAMNMDKTDYVLGLFSSGHMDYEIDRNTNPSGQPSLAEMTRAAIHTLRRNSKGFFLMVEGARIDHAHHETKAKKALYDTLAFEEAVQVALNLTNPEETLTIVTADHSHVFTINGYPDRGNGILDLARPIVDNMALDNQPYTTLMYTNGPNAQSVRANLTFRNTQYKEFQQQSTVPLSSETHGGEDVAIYAQGPMAHLVTGVKEQNVIAYVMAHAACVGDTGIPCENGREQVMNGQNNILSDSRVG
ncbi:alkaline phosphatase, tissue-nonspecific isozyme-like isoform X2 [Mya arenaria]|uniref:alkaline phosphatase, tissue-nonspecific isozyme-like isoform X2 n=1 Tax=Mya arenaria TaxID=6604 RepID=UPI0022DEB6C2|nr:alkaline phosphatase, tissue-nonspecific isozyme-like isoform X2 [Mya arenaria]